MKFLILTLTICFGIISNAQCKVYDKANNLGEQAYIAAFADKGTGKYKNEILWLNWGATSVNDTNGSSKTLTTSDYSNAEIKINDDKFICIKTKILAVDKVNSSQVDRAWSIMDETYDKSSVSMYNILKNTNNGNLSSISLSSVAYVISRKSSVESFSKAPIKIKGLVLADSESASSTEYMTLSANGTWHIIEFINLSGSKYNYHIRKEADGTNNKITMGYGEDKSLAAINMLKFNDNAYDTSSNDYKVNYLSTFKGSGTTSIAIGLITPYADFGDAPEKYSSPMHLIETLEMKPDNYSTESLSTVSGRTNYVNIGKSSSFVSGELAKSTSNFIGSASPDADVKPHYSKDAKSDDYSFKEDGTRNILTSEENGWPVKYQGFSYKTVNGSQYPVGALISAEIPVNVNKKSVLAGWIDFNVDGIFDESEKVYKVIETLGSGNITLDWRIPFNRKPYSTFARLRLFDFTSVSNSNVLDNSLIVPNSDVIGGEVEDHQVKIFGQVISNPMILNSSPLYKD